MNDMEEEIDRIEKISYMKINNHYTVKLHKTRVAQIVMESRGLGTETRMIRWMCSVSRRERRSPTTSTPLQRRTGVDEILGRNEKVQTEVVLTYGTQR